MGRKLEDWRRAGLLVRCEQLARARVKARREYVGARTQHLEVIGGSAAVIERQRGRARARQDLGCSLHVGARLVLISAQVVYDEARGTQRQRGDGRRQDEHYHLAADGAANRLEHQDDPFGITRRATCSMRALI